MDNWIHELEQLTGQMLAKLDEISQDEWIQYIDRREEIVDQIRAAGLSGPIQEKYRQRVAQLLKSDELVRSRIAEIQRENQQGIAKTNQAKIQRAVYDADYAMGGFMFDKRK